MEEAEYIAAVCEANRLKDTIDWMVRSCEEVYFADRHVDVPPANLPRLAACAAGLALLVQWSQEADALLGTDLFATSPMLIVDQEWIDERENAPAPHLVLTLARNQSMLNQPNVCGQTIDIAECPFGSLLAASTRSFGIVRINPSEERESLGCWIVGVKE